MIAGFNLANNRRMEFNYRTHCQIFAYSIRKSNWRHLQKDYEFFIESMNQSFVAFYAARVLKPLLLFKRRDLTNI